MLVQAQLSAAQASWSEEQDLWIDEVGSFTACDNPIPATPRPVLASHCLCPFKG